MTHVRDIYALIDELDEAGSVHELVRKLKPILEKLAYYAVTSEGGVLEDHETWRAEYHAALQHERAMDSTPIGGSSSSSATYVPRPEPKPKPKSSEGKSRSAPKNTRTQVPDDIPESLRLIMSGKHSSFKEPDD